MRKFNELPEMREETTDNSPVAADLPAEVAASLAPDAMRCGGCGAKVGQAMLGQALRHLSNSNGEVGSLAGQDANDVVLGIGDDAAAIRLPGRRLLLQTVDSFPAMIDDPYVFGRIAANHCLGDVYAMAASPHSALLIASLPFGAREKREADLVQLLAGARKQLDAADCAIIGGHTAESLELTLGLAVNGFADEGAILRKDGLSPGDVLVLTKPLGTGALFAANGRRRAKGRWVRNAVASALMPTGAAAEILPAHGAKAMTDVTGFGLAGHLGEMLDAANVTADLRLSDIPFLEGAQEVVDRGIVSSLQADNLVWRSRMDAPSGVASQPGFQLLFDPQTAGGLLAGIPREHAAGAISALKDAGYERAAIIGVVGAGASRGPIMRVGS